MADENGQNGQNPILTLLLLCKTAATLLPLCTLTVTLFKLLHNNVLQAILSAAMHDK